MQILTKRSLFIFKILIIHSDLTLDIQNFIALLADFFASRDCLPLGVFIGDICSEIGVLLSVLILGRTGEENNCTSASFARRDYA